MHRRKKGSRSMAGNRGDACLFRRVRHLFAALAVVCLAAVAPLGAQTGPEIHTTLFRGKLISYQVRDGLAFFEGDILLGPADEIGRMSIRPLASVWTPASQLWTGGVVPYSIDANTPNLTDISDAITEWNTKLAGVIQLTACQKVGVDPCFGHANYVHMMSVPPSQNCYSYIGMIGGPQELGLSPGCDKPRIVHELGHAIGLLHEQSRNDRDGFVTVLLQNVISGQTSNFDKAAQNGLDVGPYNYLTLFTRQGSR